MSEGQSLAIVCRHRQDLASRPDLRAWRASVVCVARLPRNVLGDGVYHVTARGVAGAPIVVDDFDREAFRDLLTAAARRFRWRMQVWCLLTTHYHVLVETTLEELSGGMHRVNGLYAQRFNRRHGRRGHLFENRFGAYVVESDAHFESAYRYIVENPVRAGLCRHADEWRWRGGDGSRVRRNLADVDC